MQLNISHTNSFQFENRENLKNYAKNILTRQGASQETSQRLVDQTIFKRQEANYAPHLAIIKASSQISANSKLKETLKYLKTKSLKKNAKEPVLGELWNLFSKSEVDYNGELSDFEIDESLTNIFAA